MKIYFSVNDYDRDGDVYDQNIRLHFGGVSIKIGSVIEDFDDAIKQLVDMRKELNEELLVTRLEAK